MGLMAEGSKGGWVARSGFWVLKLDVVISSLVESSWVLGSVMEF